MFAQNPVTGPRPVVEAGKGGALGKHTGILQGPPIAEPDHRPARLGLHQHAHKGVRVGRPARTYVHQKKHGEPHTEGKHHATKYTYAYTRSRKGSQGKLVLTLQRYSNESADHLHSNAFTLQLLINGGGVVNVLGRY